MSFAVVKTGGKQYKASLGDVLEVEKLEGKAGDKVELASLAASGDIEGKTKVVAEIVSQKKAEKVLIFKKRRRKNSRRLNGHRQPLTELKIVEIGGDKLKEEKKAAPAKKAKVKEEPKAEKKETKKEVKKPAAKKPAAKKAPAKKAEAKKDGK